MRIVGNLSSETCFAFLGGPVPVGIAVVHQLVGPSIAHLGCRVRERALGAPFDRIARRLGHEERLGAARVAVLVAAFLDGVVHDAALGDGGGWGEVSQTAEAYGGGWAIHSPAFWVEDVGLSREVSRQEEPREDLRSVSVPVSARPAAITV